VGQTEVLEVLAREVCASIPGKDAIIEGKYGEKERNSWAQTLGYYLNS
jgi:hypothetical protein